MEDDASAISGSRGSLSDLVMKMDIRVIFGRFADRGYL
jgi:hypothetical protein